MKKLILIPLLALGVLQAADTNNTKRIETMQNLEKAMGTIQKGLMYNNRSIIENGINDLKTHTKDINAFNIENEKDSRFKAKKYAVTESKAIAVLADDILKGYDKKSKNRVLDTYRRLQNRCMICHQLVRKW